MMRGSAVGTSVIVAPTSVVSGPMAMVSPATVCVTPAAGNALWSWFQELVPVVSAAVMLPPSAAGTVADVTPTAKLVNEPPDAAASTWRRCPAAEEASKFAHAVMGVTPATTGR